MKQAKRDYTAENHAFLAGSYTAKGKKLLTNFGGNFWGINRKRCTIIKPEQIEEMVKRGMAYREGSRLKIIVLGA
jgi:hypothetical protein